MTNRSKRYSADAGQIDVTKSYTPEEAIELAQKTSTVKFDASVEIHIRLGIDPKQSDQQIRGTITLPHSTGKTKTIAAFVDPDKEKEAKEAGADFVYDEAQIDKIAQTGKIDFEIAVGTPTMMPKIAKLAKILGPKGMMPNPKTDTVGTNVTKMIEDLKKGKIAYKNDATSNIHQVIGKVSMDSKALLENLEAFTEALKKAKPPSAKGVYMKSVTLTTSMGPGIKVELA